MVSAARKEKAIEAVAAIVGVFAFGYSIRAVHDLISAAVDPAVQGLYLLELGISSLATFIVAGASSFVLVRGSVGWKQLCTAVVDTAPGLFLVAGIALFNTVYSVSRLVTSGQVLTYVVPALFWAFYGVRWYRTGLVKWSQSRQRSSNGPEAEAIP
ncbi:hypothetical protein [Mycobacteroides abscessus]